MQRCARFVRDLLCITFSKKHNGWQLEQAAFYLVFTNSQESEGMLWDKGLPTVSYLRASECLQLGKAFNETCGAGSVRNPTSRAPAAGAVVPEELRDIDIRGQKKTPKLTQPKNHNKPKNPTFFSGEDCIVLVQEAPESLWIQSKAGKEQGYSGQGKIYFCILLVLLSYKAGLACLVKKVHCFSLS